LGYTPDTWHQEITFGNIRLDFLSFAVQVIPFTLNADSPLSLVLEAKHPKQNLDRHIRKLKRYLTSLNVRYGLLTNGKELRIYARLTDEVKLVFQCQGKQIESKIDEIKELVGRDSLQYRQTQSIISISDHNTELDSDPEVAISPENNQKEIDNVPESQLTENQSQSLEIIPCKTENQASMKIIAVYHNKGGVGKTTTVVNLAAALSKKGYRVLIIDLDSQANTTFATGLAKFVDEKDDDLIDNNIYNVISSRTKYFIKDVARKSQFCDSQVDVVPAHINLMKYERRLVEIEPAKTRLCEKLKQSENDYDIVIIDTPPSLNIYAKIALITADYLIIPSDLKPFANEGLKNVQEFIQEIDEVRQQWLGKLPIKTLGVLPSKISTNHKFRSSSLPKRKAVIEERYNMVLMESIIFEREDLSKAVENYYSFEDIDIPDPKSIFDYKPDSLSAEEFEQLALEVIQKIGI
jgi:cellulose biosynthesis protein BcsQ